MLAIMPEFMEVHDLLIYFRGGYVPVVPRSSNTCVRQGEIIGDCRIHGVGDIYHGTDWETFVDIGFVLYGDQSRSK